MAVAQWQSLPGLFAAVGSILGTIKVERKEKEYNGLQVAYGCKDVVGSKKTSVETQSWVGE